MGNCKANRSLVMSLSFGSLLQAVASGSRVKEQARPLLMAGFCISGFRSAPAAEQLVDVVQRVTLLGAETVEIDLDGAVIDTSSASFTQLIYGTSKCFRLL